MIQLPHGFMLETMPVPPDFTMADFAISQRESVVEWWREKGDVPFCAWLDGMAPWGERRVVCVAPSEVQDGTTNIASQIIRRLVAALQVRAVLITMESWFAHLEPKEGETPGDVRGQRPKSLQNYDGRREALFMALEERGKPAEHWFAEIHRNPDRVDPWELREFKDSEGRLGSSWFKQGGG